jgi:hypothetical protein
VLEQVAKEQNLFDIKHNSVKRTDVIKRKAVIDRIKAEKEIFMSSNP